MVKRERLEPSSSAEHLDGKHHNAKRPEWQHQKHRHSVDHRQQLFHGSLTCWRCLGHDRCGSLGCERNITNWSSDGAGTRLRKLNERRRRRWVEHARAALAIAYEVLRGSVSRSRLRCAVAQRSGLVVGRVAGTCQDGWSVPSRPKSLTVSSVSLASAGAAEGVMQPDDVLTISWAAVGDLCGCVHKPALPGRRLCQTDAACTA